MSLSIYRANAKQVLRVGAHFCDAVSNDAANAIVEAMNNYGPQLRYELTKVEVGYRYGDWHIQPASWVAIHRSIDWSWVHDDYDGAPDANDHRCGVGESAFDCIQAIHDWEDEQ